MLGIIIVVFIGRNFFKLADEYNQNKWVFAILGIVTYYVGAFMGGIILGVADEFLGIDVNWDNTLVLTLIAMPFGLGSVYLLYTLLKKNWKKNFVAEKNEIQEIGKNTDD